MNLWRELKKHPSALAGLAIMILFFIFSIHTIITLPYSEAIRLWRGGPGVWDEAPRRAAPLWYNYFTAKNLPETIVVSLDNGAAMKVEPIGDGMNRVEIVFPFTFEYDDFPKEISLYFQSQFVQTYEYMSVYMYKPNGEMVTLDDNHRMRQTHSYRISQDMGLRMKLGGASPHVGLFTENPASPVEPLRGEYQLVMEGELPEGSEIREAKLVVYGQVYGLAGTDHLRRDLTVALRWGAPVGLLFGVLAAFGAQVSTFILGAIGTWFGGKLDALFHRITEVSMVLPFLAILIMVGHYFSRSIWVMLGAVIILNVFSSSMKVYRAMFLQAKQSAYIEAARAYGAGNFRIIFRYLIPRLIPVLLPQMVTVIPVFVFLEASLAVLGLGDPVLPTWGKIIHDAQANSALYLGNYYWMIQPAVMLMLIGFSFALVGYTLDRILNPRLRKI